MPISTKEHTARPHRKTITKEYLEDRDVEKERWTAGFRSSWTQVDGHGSTSQSSSETSALDMCCTGRDKAIVRKGKRIVNLIGLDRYRYRVSANTRQYRWVSVAADNYLSIGADTSSPVVRLPVSTVNTAACTPIVSSLYCIFVHIPQIHI